MRRSRNMGQRLECVQTGVEALLCSEIASGECWWRAANSVLTRSDRRGITMLIHGFVDGSRVNGPGLRAVVYFQGCTLGCRNCWNPETHAFAGKERSIAEVTGLVVSAHQERALEGVTFSGGEPMEQADALLALIE